MEILTPRSKENLFEPPETAPIAISRSLPYQGRNLKRVCLARTFLSPRIRWRIGGRRRGGSRTRILTFAPSHTKLQSRPHTRRFAMLKIAVRTLGVSHRERQGVAQKGVRAIEAGRPQLENAKLL